MISNITSGSADNNYSAGASIDVTVTFSEAVTLTGDTLNITTNANGSSPVVNISPFAADGTPGGSYVVQAGDSVGDFDSTAIALGASGVLEDLAGNTAVVALPANTIGDLHNIIIDAIIPTIASITSVTTNGSYGETEAINVTVTFSESVTLAGGNLNITLDTGGFASILDGTCTAQTSCSASYTVGSGENSTDLDSTVIALL